VTTSGAGTNLKVGEAPVQSKSGGTDPAQSVGKKFFLVMPLHFLALKVKKSKSISHSGKRFHDGQ